MNGRRREDNPIGPIPNDAQPGDYWRVQKHDGSRALDVLLHEEDRRYWGEGAGWDGNLTGIVMGFIDPNGNYGMCCIHTVREEEDGTFSVRPGDGSSNSILNTYNTPAGDQTWHGYMEHGVWNEC